MARKYIFTNKKHSYKGLMATSLGVIDVYTMIYTIYSTYKNGGEAPSRYAATVVLVLVFAFVGIILGLLGKSDADKFSFFSYVGIILNVVALLIVSGVLYAGAYMI